MKIGFIGIGIMGAPMAGHLLDAGHEVAVNDINPIAQELLDKGAQVVAGGGGLGREPGVRAGALHRADHTLTPSHAGRANP